MLSGSIPLNPGSSSPSRLLHTAYFALSALAPRSFSYTSQHSITLLITINKTSRRIQECVPGRVHGLSGPSAEYATGHAISAIWIRANTTSAQLIPLLQAILFSLYLASSLPVSPSPHQLKALRSSWMIRLSFKILLLILTLPLNNLLSLPNFMELI